MKHKYYQVIYEDDFLMAIDKFAGVLSIADRYNAKTPNLVNLLRRNRETVLPVHRLDQYTSGLILFAKNPDIHRDLNIMFEKREIEKKYLAICEGNPPWDSHKIEQPIVQHPQKKGFYIISKKGKDSTSEFKVLERFRNFALLEIEIKTGRTHQIRVHLKSVNHPVLADSVYGFRDSFYLSLIKKKNYRISAGQVERPLISRQALHSSSIKFCHPILKKEFELKSALPKDMKACIYQLRKWSRRVS